MNIMNTNPFRPGSGLFPSHFAGREEEVKVFERKLQSTRDGVPMHIAVLGEWGIGKTSLLTKFENNDSVRSVFAAPDRKYIVSGSKDRTIKIWDFESRECIKTIEQKLKCSGMNIKGAKGLSEEQIKFLKERGAVD